MPEIYFDPQTPSKLTRTGATIAAIKHAATRFLIGNCLFICDDPRAVVPAARRKWLSLARLYDKKRSMTFDADRSVKYTYLQLQMQLVRFTSNIAREADLRTVFVFCSVQNIPPEGNFTTIYNLTERPLKHPLDSLVSSHGANYITYIDEKPHSTWLDREELETHVETCWTKVLQFLETQRITISDLTTASPQRDNALDKALDTLLTVSEAYLTLVTDFRAAYERARPLTVHSSIAQLQDLVLLLAYRVQCLSSPHEFAHFLEIYEERDDLALLNDSRTPPRKNLTTLTRQKLIQHHKTRGNHNIAKALQNGAHTFEASCRHCLLSFIVEH